MFERYPLDEVDISGRFGDDYGTYTHRGVDFRCHVGTPVYAPADGVTVWFQNDGSFGVAICLRHDQAPDYFRFSLYAHLDARLVPDGMLVRAGQLMGYSGNTGKSTGPHLHWQLCATPYFPIDITQSVDPLSRMITEDSPMTPSERVEFEAMKQRVADLESALAGSQGGVQAAKMQGLNLLMGVNNLNEAVKARIMQHSADGHGVSIVW